MMSKFGVIKERISPYCKGGLDEEIFLNIVYKY